MEAHNPQPALEAASAVWLHSDHQLRGPSEADRWAVPELLSGESVCS